MKPVCPNGFFIEVCLIVYNDNLIMVVNVMCV